MAPTDPRQYLTDLVSARKEYADLGFVTLPVMPGLKNPMVKGWPTGESDEMWSSAPMNANIGIRMDGDIHLAVIDCDDKTQLGTFDRVSQYLLGLGYQSGDYPVVKTASGIGRHIYLKLDAELERNWIPLLGSFGSGELRHGSGAHVVAPPSIVAGIQYSLIEGSFASIPTIPLPDILLLIPASEPSPNQVILTPASMKSTSISRLAQELLAGKKFSKYRSRSEAEQALILSLINSGHSFESILELFKNNPGQNKFRDKYEKDPRAAVTYLERSYNKAYLRATTQESTGRSLARNALDWSTTQSWPGRTGSTDRAVFIAHAIIAYNSGRSQYAASSRELAENANVTNKTASRATNRLINQGRIKRVRTSHDDRAAEYVLSDDLQKAPHPHRRRESREWVNMQSHDAFHHDALGKASCEIYQLLQEEPMTANQLAEKTGRSITTIHRKLKLMSSIMDFSTGEEFAMVIKKNGLWTSQEVDLDVIAKSFGTNGAGERKRERHKQEREVHRYRFHPDESINDKSI